MRDIEHGVALVIRVKSTDVAEIDGYNDEGRKFCFRLDEKLAVLLRGCGTTPGRPGRRETGFPNDDFEIVALPQSRVMIAFHIHGKRFQRSKKLDANVDQHVHGDSEPFELDWEAFLRGEVTV